MYVFLTNTSVKGVTHHAKGLTEQFLTRKIAKAWDQSPGNGIGNGFVKNLPPTTKIFTLEDAATFVEPLEKVSKKRNVHLLVDEESRGQGQGKRIFHMVAKMLLSNPEYDTKILEVHVVATGDDRNHMDKILRNIPDVKCVKLKNLSTWILTMKENKKNKM